MRAVAERRILRLLALTERNLLRFFHREFHWPELSAFMRAVAEGLFRRLPTATPEVVPRLKIEHGGFAICDFRFTHHEPPVFSLRRCQLDWMQSVLFAPRRVNGICRCLSVPSPSRKVEKQQLGIAFRAYLKLRDILDRCTVTRSEIDAVERNVSAYDLHPRATTLAERMRD